MMGEFEYSIGERIYRDRDDFRVGAEFHGVHTTHEVAQAIVDRYNNTGAPAGMYFVVKRPRVQPWQRLD